MLQCDSMNCAACSNRRDRPCTRVSKLDPHIAVPMTILTQPSPHSPSLPHNVCSANWNGFGCSYDDATFRQQADFLVSSGMAAAGCAAPHTRTTTHAAPHGQTTTYAGSAAPHNQRSTIRKKNEVAMIENIAPRCIHSLLWCECHTCCWCSTNKCCLSRESRSLSFNCTFKLARNSHSYTRLGVDQRPHAT
jgi:hypothetical protein